MVKDEANVSQRNAEGALITDLINDELDAPVDVLVAVIKEERVLRIVLDLPYALWLSLGVVKVRRLEILLVFILIVRNIPTTRCLNHSPLKHRCLNHAGRGNRLKRKEDLLRQEPSCDN